MWEKSQFDHVGSMSQAAARGAVEQMDLVELRIEADDLAGIEPVPFPEHRLAFDARDPGDEQGFGTGSIPVRSSVSIRSSIRSICSIAPRVAA